LHLFGGFGIEIEYMIVERDALDVRPVADELLKQVADGYETEVELGAAAWSNELALHVVEIKTNGPAASLRGLGALFHAQVEHMNRLLAPMDARLLPTAMHPWMDPETQLQLWPHGSQRIYATYDRIFGCLGHGWANLQSVHLNLPFANDAEFARLHAAIRLVLPLVPGLAASSPFVEGRASGCLDTRLHYYRGNQRRVPSVAGLVIPERVFSRRGYEQGLLAGVYRDLAALDPEGVLRHEWVNSRGCIARFDRMAIEIRLIDVQECPRADIAVAAAVTAAVRSLTEELWCGGKRQREWHERELAAVLAAAIRDADETVIDNRRYLDCFGYPERGRAKLRELWQHLIETVLAADDGWHEYREPLGAITARGCLARRILDAAGPAPAREDLHRVYTDLADCLAQNALFAAT
jgi:gamma-glutamyl:cysteine ligase YbdK (ATP-grasp superfamily)